VKPKKRNHFHRLQRERYAARRFRNPYFHRAKPFRWTWAILLAVMVAAIVTLACYLLSAPMFAIRDVTIQGTQSINPTDLRAVADAYLTERRWIAFRTSNRFLFRPDDLKHALETAYAFESLAITREGSTVRIVVEEKTSQLIWKTGDVWFLVDLQGRVIRPLSDAERVAITTPISLENPPHPFSELSVCVDMNSTEVTVGEAVLQSEEIQGILQFQDLIRAQNIQPVETHVDRLAGKWISMVTSAGYEILFDPLSDVSTQAVRLETVLRDEIPDQTGLTYVDLRFGDHVYYKFR